MFGCISAHIGGRAADAGLTGAGETGGSPQEERIGPVLSGLVSGTRVATAMGWRPVEQVLPGDKVLTFDAGLQRVTKVVRHAFPVGEGPVPAHFWPIEVPKGVLGNREVMHLLPHQTIMVESDTAEDLYGDPFSLIPAEAMDALAASHRVPPQDGFEVVRLHFAAEQVVFARDGLLFLCPCSRDMAGAAWEAPQDPLYTILPMDEARFLAARIEAEAARAGGTLDKGWVAGLPA